MDADETAMIGHRIRLARERRGKSLRVVAGLAGMHYSTWCRIEHGERLITIPELYAMADALQVPLADLTRLPFPAPANGHTDFNTDAIRYALDAIESGNPDGIILPFEALRDQVGMIHQQRRDCQFTEVATALPGLIRNMHTTLGADTDRAALLDLAVYLHVHVTRMWLVHAAAPPDLVRRVVFLAQRLAQERDDATTLAVGVFGVADVLLSGGAVEPSRVLLDSIELPPVNAETAGFVAVVTGCHAIRHVLQEQPGDAIAPVDAAAELAERFDIDSVDPVPEPRGAGVSRFVFTSVDAATLRMWVALEARELDWAVRVGERTNPERHPLPVARASYWSHFGRALAWMPKRRADAVRALRAAERLFPTMVLRDPKVRDTLAYMLTKSIPAEAGRELRAMAQRAGLQV